MLGASWLTLCDCFAGSPPLVIAHGGFSGIFPDSSDSAYILAAQTSLPNAALWCDVQLTKDAVGICLPSLNLLNSTNILGVFPNKSTSYLVNGVPTDGYFSVDYTYEDLSSLIGKFNSCWRFSFVVIDSVFCELIDSFVTHMFVLWFKIFSMFTNFFLWSLTSFCYGTVTQGVYTRSPLLDGNGFVINKVDEVLKLVAPQTPGLWLNIQVNGMYNLLSWFSLLVCSKTNSCFLWYFTARCILYTTQFEHEKLCTFSF